MSQIDKQGLSELKKKYMLFWSTDDHECYLAEREKVKKGLPVEETKIEFWDFVSQAIVKAKESEQKKLIEKLKKVSYFEADSIDRNGYKTQSVKVGRGAYQLIHKSQIDDLIEALSKKEL